MSSRHVYTREQRAILEASFARQSHPDIHEKERLARLFNCNLIQIANWFQNHRRRMKKQQKIHSSNTPSGHPVVYHQQEYLNDYSSLYQCYYYPTTQCVYTSSCHAPQSYEQTMSYEPFVTYYQP